MLLLHGFGNEAHLWDDFAPLVAPSYRVIAVDQRGHGDSDHDPERRYDTEDMADMQFGPAESENFEHSMLDWLALDDGDTIQLAQLDDDPSLIAQG